MKTTYLKVKNKHLAAEAAIIRHEERKARARQRAVFDDHWKLRQELARHRRMVVRPARRHAHLAACFLRGTPYKLVEAKCHETPDWHEVQRMALKYGSDDKEAIEKRFGEWSNTKLINVD